MAREEEAPRQVPELDEPAPETSNLSTLQEDPAVAQMEAAAGAAVVGPQTADVPVTALLPMSAEEGGPAAEVPEFLEPKKAVSPAGWTGAEKTAPGHAGAEHTGLEQAAPEAVSREVGRADAAPETPETAESGQPADVVEPEAVESRTAAPQAPEEPAREDRGPDVPAADRQVGEPEQPPIFAAVPATVRQRHHLPMRRASTMPAELKRYEDPASASADLGSTDRGSEVPARASGVDGTALEGPASADSAPQDSAPDTADIFAPVSSEAPAEEPGRDDSAPYLDTADSAAAEEAGTRTAGSTAVPAAGGAAGAAGAVAAAGSRSSKPPQTSELFIRPPEEEVSRRVAEREEALRAKPVAGRILQALLAVCYPVILVAGAIRLLTTPLFLWFEYNRPGFPVDTFGFSVEDRMVYGSHTLDYVMNWAGPRYLSELVNAEGDNLFLPAEVEHMRDVKWVLALSFVAATVLLIVSVIAALYLARRYKGGIRRGLFAGSVATVVLIGALAAVALLAWDVFFTALHNVFFAEGTWTFRFSDTLIRLFPPQFWVDSGIAVGLLVLMTAITTMVFTWPTKERRRRSMEAQRAARERYLA